MLGNSATSQALESCGLMKRRSCSALQSCVYCSPELGSSWVSPLCFCVHPCCVLDTFSFKPVICSGSHSLLWATFGSCGVSGPVLGPVGLVGSASARDAVAAHYRALSPGCPLRSFPWWVGPAIRPTLCPQPSAGAAIHRCMWLSSPHPRDGGTLV